MLFTDPELENVMCKHILLISGQKRNSPTMSLNKLFNGDVDERALPLGVGFDT